MPAVREVILIKSSEAEATRHFRNGRVWEQEEIVGLDKMRAVLGVPIPLTRIWPEGGIGGGRGARRPLASGATAPL